MPERKRSGGGGMDRMPDRRGSYVCPTVERHAALQADHPPRAVHLAAEAAHPPVPPAAALLTLFVPFRHRGKGDDHVPATFDAPRVIHHSRSFSDKCWGILSHSVRLREGMRSSDFGKHGALS